MAELLQRLQQALGDRYSLDRELGLGGMDVVYLSIDLKHDLLHHARRYRPATAHA
ncbi:MAG TPA: hypothetical protein VNL18_08525 [Gemmatimonadales bacterium]|nr:hypothetical protein [Gemmatimonadales bacterium]